MEIEGMYDGEVVYLLHAPNRKRALAIILSSQILSYNLKQAER